VPAGKKNRSLSRAARIAHRKSLFTALLGKVIWQRAIAENQPLMVPIKRFSIESALRRPAQRGRLPEGRSRGGVTVLDRGRHPEAESRDVLAPDPTLRLSR
jgi:hypothetical protein